MRNKTAQKDLKIDKSRDFGDCRMNTLASPFNDQEILIFNPRRRRIQTLEFQINEIKMGSNNRTAVPAAPPTECGNTRKKTSSRRVHY